MTTFLGLDGGELGFERGLHVGDEVKGDEFELTDADLAAVHVEVLEVAEDEGARRAAGNRGLGGEELHAKGLDVGDAGDCGEFRGSLAVHVGGRRRLEDHRVGENGAEHGAGDVGRDFKAHVVVHALEDGVRAAGRPDDAFERSRGGHVAELVMVDDALEVALINVGGSLGLVGVVDEVDVAAGDARHDFRSFKAEALEDEGRFRGGRALGGRHDVQTTLLVEMRAGNGGNDAVGVGVLMTKNESGHFEAFLKRG